MKRSLFSLAVAIILALLFVLAALPLAVSAQQEVPPPRDLETILSLYEGDPAVHMAPEGIAGVEDVPGGEGSDAAASPQAYPALSRIVYESYISLHWDLRVLDPVSGASSGLTDDDRTETTPNLQPGGQKAVYAVYASGEYDLYTLDINGGSPIHLTDAPGSDINPVYSPDRTRIAFHSNRSGDTEVYVMNADGSNLVQLTYAPGFDGYPSWSPEGSQLVFTSHRDGNYQLWIMNADGSGLHQLNSSLLALYPAWSPKGDWIAYSCDTNGNGWLELCLISPDGMDHQELVGDTERRDSWAPSWSPDQQYLSLTQTDWVLYYGNYYWTQSYILSVELATGSLATLRNDDRAWRSSWASTDSLPPSPCTVSAGAEQRGSDFLVSFAAQEGESALNSYDLQVRSLGGAWQDLGRYLPASDIRAASALYQGAQTASLEFRCRARDVAGNVSNWEDSPPAVVTVDAAWPVSNAFVGPWMARNTVEVSLGGSDVGSGLAYYNLYARAVGGDWELVEEALTGNTTTFAAAPGYFYEFRSQAVDNFGHTQPWQPFVQDTVGLYATQITLQGVSDNRGNPLYQLPDTVLEGSPLLTVRQWVPGRWDFYLGEADAHSLVLNAEGFGTLPAASLPTEDGADAGLAWVFPPAADAAQNGGFEEGLAGWGTAGEVQAVPGAGHTGAAGARLADGAVLSQTLWIDPAWHAPTLSLLYELTADLPDGAFSVGLSASLAPSGTLTSTVLSTTLATEGWAHAWADLAAYAGLTTTLHITMTGGTALLDEVSIGAWEAPVVGGASPAAWPLGSPATLVISGENFIDGARVWLGEVELSSVTWVSATQLTAAAPASLEGGAYDLVVRNPSGAATAQPGAITVQAYEVHLPIILRHLFDTRLAQNGAAWPTLGANPAHDGYLAAEWGASRYALAWNVDDPNPSGVYLSLAAFDDMLIGGYYANGGPNAVVGLQASTGQVLWSIDMGISTFVDPPTLAYSSVYLQSNGNLFNLDAYHGTMRWQVPTPGYGRNALPPLAAEGNVYISGGTSVIGPLAYDAASGRLRWFTPIGQANMAYHEGLLYICYNGALGAYDPAFGALVWQTWVQYCPYDTGGAPPLVSARTALVTSLESVTAVNLDTRTAAWSTTGYYPAMSAAADGVAYILREGVLEARSLANGDLLHTFSETSNLLNAPLVTRGYVYAASEMHTYVFDRQTYALVWEVDRGGRLTVADGFLYIADYSRNIYAYRAQEP